MSKFEIAKKIAKWTAKTAITASTSSVVHDVIDSNVDAETRLEKAMLWIGSIAISATVTDRVWEHVSEKATEGMSANGDFSKIDFSQCQTEETE